MIILISYTSLFSPGGVPRFCNDFIKSFGEENCKHYSWWDVAQASNIDPNSQFIPEWEKAKILNKWLLSTKRVTENDIIIADSFWADGLEHLPKCISHQHGNWGHITLNDVKKGIQPEFPIHAKVQEDFRRKYLKAGRKLTAVSDFIANQMKLQWNFDSTVINNGIDLDKFKPAEKKTDRKRPIIIHFTTTANKGLDHIDAVKKEVDADVWLLDEAAVKLNLPKYEALAQADLVVHPSQHEGCSYAVLETMASGVQIFAYDVGLLYEIAKDYHHDIGIISPRSCRTPKETKNMVDVLLLEIELNYNKNNSRNYASKYSIQNFWKNWKDYLKKEFNYG